MRTMGAPKGYVRKPEAALRLAIKERTLDNWMKRGFVKFIKVGRNVYFRESELMEAFGERSSTVEQKAYNLQVGGSIPSAPTNCGNAEKSRPLGVTCHQVVSGSGFRCTRTPDGQGVTAGETACDHSEDIEIPSSAFIWCSLCGAIKRKTNDPTVGWIKPKYDPSRPRR